jgi:hypothetical protein
MKKYSVLFLLLLIAASCVGCGYRTPEKCQEAVFNAITNDQKDKFFDCVLAPPKDEKERDAVFSWVKENYKPFIGGKIMSKNEVDNIVILNISPSADYLSLYGSALAPAPLALAFTKEKGYKLDLEYTEKIKELHEMYKGLLQ